MKKVYENCALVAHLYIEKHANEWKLGGPGMVVMVDEFPGGCMSHNTMDNMVNKKRNNNSHTILCIAEANKRCIPPNMWFHVVSGHVEVIFHKRSLILFTKIDFEAM